MAIAKHKSRRSELRESRVLARRVQRGDRRAFELLYASYEGGLFRVAHRLTGSSEQAAALVQATFTRALATLPERGFDSVDVGAHLFGTVRSLSYERNGAREGLVHGDGHDTGTTWVRAGGERAREVVAANARLAPRQRLALALRDLEGRPDDEIALALGTESPSVPALVARARLRLREELALPSGGAACADHLADLSAYADGTLPATGRAALEAHLEQCADCRAALFALREATQRYRAVPVPVPPGELSSRMAAALGAFGLPGRAPAIAGAIEAARALASPPEPAAESVLSPIAGAAIEAARALAAPAPVAVAAEQGAALAAPVAAETMVARHGAAIEPAFAPAATPATVHSEPLAPERPCEIARPVEPVLAPEPVAFVPALEPEPVALVPEAEPEPEPVALAAPAALAVPAAPPPAPLPLVAAARGGRQTTMAVVMATLVLIGIVVTLVARDSGGSKPAAEARRAAPVVTGAAENGGALPPLQLPQVGAPLLVAVAAGGRVPLPPPRKLRHVRSGTQVFPHRSIPIRPKGSRAAARIASGRSRVSATARARAAARARSAAAAARPAKSAPFAPQPIPAPEARGKAAVQVPPFSAPPSTATPASAGTTSASDGTGTPST